ncbi:MAG: RNA 2',3'-cyclic phosphodiesterase [Chloroflexi bacterium]|nr:MAG: RNA 2',3'-cyclic phosphodiesterase [Chloroflexota bacterium]
MRLFVAVEIPDAWRSIASATNELIGASVGPLNANMRFVDPSLMHITLRFLGEVPEERIADLDAALRHRMSPVDVGLALGTPSTFGPPTRTQVVWLGVRGNVEGLRVLVRRVDLALADAGVKANDARFNPHITLARLDRHVSGDDRRQIAELVGFLPAPHPYTLRVTSVALVRSTLGGPRPVYDVLKRYS